MFLYTICIYMFYKTELIYFLIDLNIYSIMCILFFITCLYHWNVNSWRGWIIAYLFTVVPLISRRVLVNSRCWMDTSKTNEWLCHICKCHQAYVVSTEEWLKTVSPSHLVRRGMDNGLLPRPFWNCQSAGVLGRGYPLTPLLKWGFNIRFCGGYESELRGTSILPIIVKGLYRNKREVIVIEGFFLSSMMCILRRDSQPGASLPD